jgi:hypothetical protein
VCVSKLTLDRYALGELPGPQGDAVSAHLAGCGDCAVVHAFIIADGERFAREQPVSALAAAVLARAAERGPRALLRRLAFPLVAMCAAAAGLALWALPADREGGRTKGAAFSLSSYVLHAEGAQPAAPHLGEALHPGDRLQFRYNGGQGGFLAEVAVDSAGKVSVYYPPGPTAAPVPAGHEVALSTAVELDDALGRETVVAVRCDRPLAVADVVRAAQQAVDVARNAGNAPTDLGALGLPCAETRHAIAKTTRPSP